MAKSILFSGTTGGPIKDTDVMAYKEEGVISGDPKRLHLFSAMKEYFQGLLPGRVTDVETSIGSLGSLELPTIGEAIDPDIDELFIDGVNSTGITSDGRVPIIYSSDHEPAIISVDGSEIANPLVKFPNRGVEGFFNEYENVIGDIIVDNSLSVSNYEGDWLKVESTSTIVDSNQASSVIDCTATTDGYVSIIVRKGILTGDSKFQLELNGVSNGFFVLNFSNKTVSSVGSNLVDRGTYFFDDDTAQVELSFTGTASSIYIYAHSYSTTTIGDYSLVKDLMITDLSYPVPYIKDTHLPTYGQYYFDWASSQNWTIEFWAYNNNSHSGNTATMFLTYGDEQSGGRIYFSDTSTSIVMTNYVDGSDYGSPADGTPLTSGNYNFIKLIIEDTLRGSIKVNDGVITRYSNFSINFSTMPKSLYLGNQFGAAYPLNSYIADLVIKPYVDESDDHYLSGLPHYNPDTTYGKNGSFSISKDGTVKTNNLESSGRRVPTITSGDGFPTYNVGLGDECYRTDLDEFYKYNGTVWLQI